MSVSVFVGQLPLMVQTHDWTLQMCVMMDYSGYVSAFEMLTVGIASKSPCTVFATFQEVEFSPREDLVMFFLWFVFYERRNA